MLPVLTGEMAEEYRFALKAEREHFVQETGRADFWTGAKWREPEEMRKILGTVFRFAECSFLARGYLTFYRWKDVLREIEERQYTGETVAGHMGFFSYLVAIAAACVYGEKFVSGERNEDGYFLADLMLLPLLHNLQEGVDKKGDRPENGTRDEKEVRKEEEAYFAQFKKSLAKSLKGFFDPGIRLFWEFSNKSSETGRFVYSADKASAILNDLCQEFPWEFSGGSVKKYPDDPEATNQEVRVMKICERRLPDGACLASEMWSIDYFSSEQGRNLVQYDESGFFTAIIIMATVLIHGHWYEWRKRELAGES